MITGVIKNKIDKIWTDIWAGGITNPLMVIEQLTYLMFIHQLDQKELELESAESDGDELFAKIFPESPIGQSMRWSKFKDRDAEEIYRIVSLYVFPAIKSMKNGRLPDFDDAGRMIPVTGNSHSENEEETAFSKYMKDATFQIPTPQLLEKIITGLEDLYSHDLVEGEDMQGDVYEYMLGKLQTSGQNGQFRTPKHIREMMVELMEPTPQDDVCEQRCSGLIQYFKWCA